MRQAVTLTGLSSETFVAKAVSNCHNMYTKFFDYFPADAMNMWQSTMYERHTAVDLHTRYFTMRKNAPNEANILFMDGVDPDGVLSTLRKHDLIHGPDNRVSYLKTDTDRDGKIR